MSTSPDPETSPSATSASPAELAKQIVELRESLSRMQRRLDVVAPFGPPGEAGHSAGGYEPHAGSPPAEADRASLPPFAPAAQHSHRRRRRTWQRRMWRAVFPKDDNRRLYVVVVALMVLASLLLGYLTLGNR